MLSVRFIVRFIVAVCLCVSACSAKAHSPRQDYADGLTTPAGMFQAGGISLDQAVSMVQAKYGARVMRANTVEEDGRLVHYIRLMTPDRSRVWTVRVDAATGREF